MTVYEGALSGDGLSLGIVVARFNDFIGERLLAGALDGLRRHGVPEAGIDVAWVPGSFEIPITAKRMATSGRYQAIICLGAVIRGATAHFDIVAGETAAGIAGIGLETGIPTIFGVLTTETLEQAVERAGSKVGNKGYEAAVSAIEMINLLRALPDPS